MADKRAIKVETLDRLGASFQESRGITDKLTIEQMIELAKVPTASGENKLSQLVDGTLTEITAEDLAGATKIKSSAFSYCVNLINLSLPNSITEIGENAFYHCENIGTINLPNGLISIADYAFGYCEKLREIYIPITLKNVGAGAFSTNYTSKNLYYDGTLENWCDINANNWNSFSLNGSTLYFKNTQGEYEKVTELIFPNTVTEIKPNLFSRYSQITKVIIPDSVITIGNNTFEWCKISKVEMGNSVTKIGTSAFQGCSELIDITLPASITEVGNYALHIGSSNNKATITFMGTTPPTISSNTFNTSYLNKIIVPKGCGDAYKSATNFAKYADYIEETAE